MRVFIILGNTLISSYLGWRCCLCILQPPTVSRSGFVGTEVLLVGRESGSAGPQSTTEREVRFVDLAILRAQDIKEKQRVTIEFCCKVSLSATKFVELIQKAYGDGALSRTTIFEWRKRFR